MIDKYGHLKLIDFGSSYFLKDKEKIKKIKKMLD